MKTTVTVGAIIIRLTTPMSPDDMQFKVLLWQRFCACTKSGLLLKMRVDLVGHAEAEWVCLPETWITLEGYGMHLPMTRKCVNPAKGQTKMQNACPRFPYDKIRPQSFTVVVTRHSACVCACVCAVKLTDSQKISFDFPVNSFTLATEPVPSAKAMQHSRPIATSGSQSLVGVSNLLVQTSDCSGLMELVINEASECRLHIDSVEKQEFL
ncbi:hypothetical protein T265_04205 [Opisthorchis viverrini]|uniref:Uncharacterized protein n=1 Tax=Opisthorchis viverrini TaxID=6198 RepID=A0A074ZP03_OPIVI|nr:hypothetical protein T265_04205 [Opisthorchis viverrini]KER29118.1 hypothetical protein T265_04205 [Opisthorchis viverrini]